MRAILVTMAIGALVVTRTDALAQRDHAPAGWQSVPVDQLHWTKSGAIEIAPVFGRRDQPELFAIATRFPPHTTRKAHSHPALRYGLVLSGTFYHGYGGKFDDAKVERRVTGTFFTEPAGVPHFGATRDEPAVLYFVGMGPDRTDELER
jgi:quercetin dioxygenase-like cupin family protein